jgi:ABC-type Mn2+/Zn2+ transport system permease subunit/Mn-dependent DtxR family transcriptional regulator
VLFALGVLLIEQAAARHVDLDADCVLHGQLETLVWYDAPDRVADLFQWSTLDAAPRQVITLAIMCALAFIFCALFFKELRIAAFDPALATTQGFHAGFMHYALMIFVAGATVASFEAVGSILVIAMLVCPAATARLLTDRLRSQVLCSIGVSLASSMIGYLAATSIPALFEKDSVNAAGSMAVTSGALLLFAIILSPRHGLVAKAVRLRSLRSSIALDDLLGALYRLSERGEHKMSMEQLNSILPGRRTSHAISTGVKRGLLTHAGSDLALTQTGRSAAADLVRRHRLWETYLVEEAGLLTDHVHEPAEQLEHILGVQPAAGPSKDPHGKSIPDQPH